MSTRISRMFSRLKEENRPALVAYITAGDPAPDRIPSLAAALERGGADLIELGVPFSEPVADGEVIQRAMGRALEAGTTLAKTLEMARRIREQSEVPLLLFSYLNPLVRRGFSSVAREAAEAGIDGCLITDLSVEEAEPYVEHLRAAKLDTVFLAAPTSTPRRLELVSRLCTGFVYLVSRTGVTGVQGSVAPSVERLIEATRAATSLPLAVGFGISTAAQAEQVGRHADGVVVGSAFVRVIEECAGAESTEEKLEELARELSGGLRRARARGAVR